MRCGKLCGACGNQCFDRPTEMDTIEIGCPVCEGLGDECQACNGAGTIPINDCPREYVGWEISDAVGYAIHAEKGAWPVAGGLLDQAWWFTELYTRFHADVNKIEAETMRSKQRG